MVHELRKQGTGRRFALRLSLFYGTTFAIAGAYMPFFPLWLKAKEIDPAWIGIVMAMPTLARLTAVPLVTQGAERHRVISQAMLVTTVLTAFGFAALALMPNAFAIAAMLLLTACAWAPTLPLTDAYALRCVALHGVNYGPVRLWGSVAYIGGVLAGLLVEPLEQRRPRVEDESVPPRLLRQPAFLAVLVAAALIQGSHAAYYTFSAIAWEAEGFGSATIAILWSLCVAAEIALFALSPRLAVASSTLIIIGGIGAALRWTVTGLQPSIPVLGVVQTMHALSFCATHLGTMGLLARLVPGRSVASAQGYLTAIIGVVTATASIACGKLFDLYGQSIYFGMAAMAAAGGLLMLLARERVENAAARSSLAVALRAQPHSAASDG